MHSRTALFSSKREGAGRWGRGGLEGRTGDTPSCWVLTPGSGVRFILRGLGSQGEGSAGTAVSRGAVWSALSSVAGVVSRGEVRSVSSALSKILRGGEQVWDPHQQVPGLS